MTQNLPRYDSLPWYRQFWPWFLIALPGTVVVAGLFTVSIAFKYSDDLVVDEYYKDGLSINRQLEKKERAQQLGLAASFHFYQIDSQQLVEIRVPVAVIDTELRLALSHPLEADLDFEITVRESTPGLYSGRLIHAIAPRWHWILESKGSDIWRLDGTVKSADFGDASSD